MKKIIIIGLLAVIILSLIPFNTTMAPEWKLKVVDEYGNPYQNLFVRQHCRSYTLQSTCEGEINDSHTNQDGEIVFPKRTIRMNLLSRIFTTLSSVAGSYLSYHGELGNRVALDATGPNGYQVLEYNPSEPLPEKFVLKKSPE